MSTRENIRLTARAPSEIFARVLFFAKREVS